MSILGAWPPEIHFMLILLLPCAGAVAMMVKLGTFRPASIQGPHRLENEESGMLLAVLVLTSIMITGVIGVAIRPLFKGEDQGRLLALGAVLSTVNFISLL